MRIRCTVNGTMHEAEVFGLARLLDVLRTDFGLVGTKEGCGEGECGACTVLLDGRLVCSCLVPAAQADGAEIVTVEGVAARDPFALHPIQAALSEWGGAQCGICIPGMVMTGFDLCERVRRGGTLPDERAVREAISGNLCRCTGYVKIVDAIVDACQRVAKDGSSVAG